MTKKTNIARREAFFKALAETGNQTISAERARVSRSWVTLHRSTDPEFKAQMEAAIAEAKARLTGSISQAPDAAWSDIDGEELVVRGSGGSGGGRLVQVARARLKQWTPNVEKQFLRTLAATCNVKAACKTVGMSPASAYVRRAKWKSFDERWEEALEIGYARLEMVLLENGCNMLEVVEVDPDAPMPPMSVDQAIQVMGLRRRQVLKEGRGVHRRNRRRTLDEARGSIQRKIDAIVRAERMAGKPLPDFMSGGD